MNAQDEFKRVLTAIIEGDKPVELNDEVVERLEAEGVVELDDEGQITKFNPEIAEETHDLIASVAG